MKFISNCIKHICTNNSNLSDIRIILPNQYSTIYFKKELKKNIIKGFLPNFITFSKFNEEYANLSSIKDMPLWIKSYLVYLKIDPQEQFCNFLKWIPIVLQDFNDIISFTNTPKKIINFMMSKKRIESWKLNLKLKNYKNIEENLLFLKKIKVFYHELNKELLKNQIALPGMISRIAYKNIIKKSSIKQFHYFIGFNSLNKFESKIIQFLIQNKTAEIIVDGDEHYLKNNIEESGSFFRKIFSWSVINPKKLNFIENNFSNSKKIKEYPLNNSVLNAKILTNILKEIPKKEYKKTGIILCDTKLLLPILQSIPKKIQNINTNLGLSLSSFSINLFFLKFLEIKSKNQKYKKKFYFFDIQELLNHNFFPKKLKLSSEEIMKILIKNNTIFIENKILIKHFKKFPIYKLFTNHQKPEIFIKQLITFTKYLIKKNDITNINNNINIILKEINNLLNEIYEILYFSNFFCDFASLYLIFKKLIQKKKINFSKNLNGLHITGIKESSLLNFKNLIIISANESSISNKINTPSLIPLIIKDKFNINNTLNIESIFTYQFYRLIQNANNIHITYDTSNNEEKHHFIRQLELNSIHKIETIQYKFSHKSNLKKITKIKKTLYIQQKIFDWFKNGVSPNAITTYLNNPINFYKKYILNIKENKTIEEEISNQTIGRLIHKVLLKCYKKFIKIKLKLDHFTYIESSITSHLNNTIETFKINPTNFGLNYLQIKLAHKFIQQIIEFDKKLIYEGNSLKIISLEHPIKIKFSTNNIYSNLFRGIIDRIDILNNVTRIIDYKYQAKEEYILSSSSIKKNEQHIIQMIIYLLCYAKKKKINYIQIGIWGFNKINEGIQLLHYIQKKEKTNLLEFKKIEKLIISKLKKIINEIMNFKKPFIEKLY